MFDLPNHTISKSQTVGSDAGAAFAFDKDELAELILEAAWRLGRGAQHLKEEQPEVLDTPEYKALISYWTGDDTVELTRAVVDRLLELARAVPGYPETALEGCASCLDRLDRRIAGRDED